jgi:hypothetical protein
MANTLKFGNGQWATKVGSTLAYNDENGNFKPLPFNFTRSTSGTRVNKDGLIEFVTNNKPRIDFLNDSNGALLLEPTSSNAITYSEDFSQTSFWNANSNVTILKNYKSPDGTLNASKIIPNTTNSQHSIKATGKLTNSRYNYTIYVKASGNSFFQIANQATSDYVNFNLNNGTYFASNSNDEVSVDYFGDGWYRCNVYFATTFQGIYNVIIENIGSTRLESFVGNDVDGIYIWGAQAEQGSYATSYIPTQGSTVTRVQEGTFITNLDTKNIITNSGSWTAFFELELLGNEPPVDKIQLSDNSNVPRAYLYGASVGVVGTGWSGGAVLSLNTNNKIIYRGNSTQNISFFDNGINEATLSSASAPITFNRLNLYGANGAFKIKQIQLFKTALSDAECIALTSL